VTAPTVVVEAAEAWPAVGAGLGAAVIVASGGLWAARKQRRSDSEGLDRQLEHDREMRKRELEAASARLDRQLAHDRDMRDLQHLRETLAPIVAHAIDWNAFTTLHQRLKADGAQPIDDGTWTSEIVPLTSEVADVSEGMRRGSRTLVILAGPEAPIALKLKEVANDGDTLVHLARLRAQGGRTSPEIQASLDGLLIQYGNDHARFVEAANKAVRWGNDAGASEKES
jgi:hypothetical protein